MPGEQSQLTVAATIFMRFLAKLIAAGTLIFLLSAAEAKEQPSSGELPDWSGIWAPDNGINGIEGNFFGGSGGATAPTRDPNLKVTNPFLLTPEYQAIYDHDIEEGFADNRDCLAPGMPRLLMIPYPIEFFITPQKVVVMHEYQNQNRRIYTDGRQHPPADELDPSFNGHSVGHWEGDTLVVDTVGFKRHTLFDRASTHSDDLHILERIRRVGPERLEDQVTLTDAKAFIKPWTSTFAWNRKSGEDWDLKEYECQENNRN